MKLTIPKVLQCVHRKDDGDVPVGTLLDVALIVIPILFILISFREKIVDYFTEEANAVMDEGEANNKPSI